MPTVRKVHGEHGVTHVEQGHVHGHVRLAAGVRLDVGGFSPEQILGPVDGELFDFVDVFAAVVVAFSRVALGVLVGQAGAGSGAYRGGHDIF